MILLLCSADNSPVQPQSDVPQGRSVEGITFFTKKRRKRGTFFLVSGLRVCTNARLMLRRRGWMCFPRHFPGRTQWAGSSGFSPSQCALNGAPDGL